jgi:hypothetical protein
LWRLFWQKARDYKSQRCYSIIGFDVYSMRILPKLPTLAVLAICGCAAPKISLLSQDEITGFPCGAKDTGVNVRIKNVGVLPFTSFSIRLNDRFYTFCGLNPGDRSCYKNLPGIWTINEYHVWYTFANRRKGVTQKGVINQPFDYIGEEKISEGFVTINVFSNRDRKSPVVDSIKVLDDSN